MIWMGESIVSSLSMRNPILFEEGAKKGANLSKVKGGIHAGI